MPIPDYQSAMLPILRMTADAADHTLAEGVDTIAKEFKVTDEEKAQLLPSGSQRIIYSRVGWAKTYLLKAGLLEFRGRGKFRITDRGQSVLKGKPNRIDGDFFKQFPVHQAFADVSEGHLDG